MAEVQTVLFADYSEPMQAAVANVVKTEMEQRTGILTRGVAEWVRVITLAGAKLEIDLATRKFNVEPTSKQVLGILVRQYLLVGVQEGGVANG